MNNLMLILLKANVLLLILAVFYAVALRKTGYHKLNRYVLLVIFPISIIGAFVSIPVNYTNISIGESFVYEQLYSITSSIEVPVEAKNNEMELKFFELLIPMYWIGLMVFLFRSGRQLLYVCKIKRQADVDLERGCCFMKNLKPNVPFSFFYTIVIPVEYKWHPAFKTVLMHEKEHARQLHSVDVLMMELFSVVFWFNPMVYMLKRWQKEVHEILVDCIVHEKIGVKEYLHAILSFSNVGKLCGIGNSFMGSTLKNRILILTKAGKRSNAWMYGLGIAVVMLVISLFSVRLPQHNPPSLWPVDGGEISSGFGFQGQHPITKKTYIHNGVDIRAEEGTDVYASASGTVTHVVEEKGWGKLIRISHDDQYETWYAHLSEFDVAVGEIVKRGKVIGLVGSTGYSTGPHLHFEIHKNGKHLKPLDYITKDSQ